MRCGANKMKRLIGFLAAAFLMLYQHQLLLGVNGSSDGFETREASKTPKVIGGQDAPAGRFPYYVGLYLQEDAIYNCGGSLIAPDVVLSAAHCWRSNYIRYKAHVGRYNLNNPKDDYETFEIAKYIPYPLYQIETDYSGDFLILILSNATSKPPIRINYDSTSPIPNQNLTVIGLGLEESSSSSFSSGSSSATILQVTDVNAIPNDECSRATDGSRTYHDLITSDMMCAWREGKDTCSGDSGGPMLIQGNSITGKDDVQVGVTSWGFGCATETFPGVYSRVSEAAEWIDSNVCQYSKNPPAWFKCDNRTYAPLLPTNPNLPGNTYPITVAIDLDNFPQETWWFILNITGHLVYIVPKSTYPRTYKYKKVKQVLRLPVGQTYTFVIKDNGGDGLSSGGYEVRLGASGKGQILASDYNFYGYDNRTSFTLPSSLTPEPTMSPTRSNAPTISPAPTLPVRAVTVTFNFVYSYQSSYFGYEILNSAGQVLSNASIGSFGNYRYVVEKTVQLPKDERYTFVLKSSSETLYPGNCTLALGPPDAQGPVLVFSNGTFKSSGFTNEENHTFFIPSSYSLAPSVAPSGIPSWSPTVTPRPTGPLQALTLTINFAYVSYAQYFGYMLLDDRNRTIVNETYGTFESITEQRVLHVASEAQYTFVLLNELGDYLYPGNYTIALGSTADRGPIVAPNYRDGYFFESHEIVTKSTFFVPSTFTASPSMAPTLGAFVTLLIDFAGYPSEIGYSILGEFQEPVVDVPFGTYGFANKTIEQVISLPAGQEYTFVISDYFGDGRFPGKFSLITGTPGSGGKTIVSKTGIKGFKEQYPFTLAMPSPITTPTSTSKRPTTPPTRTPVLSLTPSVLPTPISTSGGVSASLVPSNLTTPVPTTSAATSSPSVPLSPTKKPSGRTGGAPSTNDNISAPPTAPSNTSPGPAVLPRKGVKVGKAAKGRNVTKGEKYGGRSGNGKKRGKLSLKTNTRG